MDVVEYDPEADILLVKLSEETVENEKLLDNDIVLGLNSKGEIVYVEVWDASKKGLTKALINLARKKKEKMKIILEAIAAK